ncbi:MAG TPA: oligosaccharide flippase family protein, partial [Myxococcota bacterium]|nr:oligosaccharide flippase family protein [Myxococcota bacterium]
ILWFAYSNLDLVIAGKLLGSDLVGIYSVALTLSWVPLRKVMPTVNDIAFSTFSRIQSDRDRVRQSVLRSVRYAFAVFLPIFWGMVLVAPDAVPIVLGEQWAGTVVPLQFVCAILPMRAIVAVIPPALFGVGRPRVNVVTTAIALPIMAVGFATGAHYGVVGLAAAWLAAYPLVFAVITTQSFPVLGVSWRDVWNNLRFPLLAGAAMVGSVLCVQLVTRDAPTLLRLIVCMASGAAVYLGVIYKADRAAITDLRALLAR